MFYLIINEQIRKYIDMIKDKHFGCKSYCPLQLIALDEMELLRMTEGRLVTDRYYLKEKSI